MYKTKIVKKIDKKLINEWKNLWKRAENSNIFNSYEWFLTSITTGEEKEYELHVCYTEKKLVAILPLQQYRCYGISVYGTINRHHLIDTAFLIEKYDKKLLKHFFGTILKKRNMYMQKVDNDACALLQKLFPQLFFSLISVNPMVKLSGDPFEAISESTLKQIKKIIKKNGDQLRYIVYKSNLEKHMETMFDLHNKSSKNARSMDIFSEEESKIYYTTLTKNFPESIRLGFLYCNTVPIAYQYGFVYRNIFVGDQIAYHNDFKKISPGKLSVYYLIEYLKKNGVKVLDEGGGISSYKMEFTKDYRLLYNIYYSSNSLIMFWWKMINKARRIRQVVSPKKFTRDHEFLFKTL